MRAAPQPPRRRTRSKAAWTRGLLLCWLFIAAPGALADAGAERLVQGFAPERLQRIDAHMNTAIEDGLMVGAQALIARGGEVVYRQTWGMANREDGDPMQRDTLYRIYSMSKPITSVALLMLYEEGHFLLNDPVAKYLPEFADARVLVAGENGAETLRPVRRAATIRDLLRHTAGLSYGVFGSTGVDRRYLEARLFEQEDLADFTRIVAAQPLLYEPGTRWHYSVAVDVQGRLVEVLSGKPFGDFLRERVFAPLGMHDTFFRVPPGKREQLAQLYAPAGSSYGWTEPWRFGNSTELEVADPEMSRPYFEVGFAESGGAGLVSTTADYLRFALMLAGEGALGDVRLLAPGTVRLLTSDHLAGMDRSGLRGMNGFGLGVGIIDNPAQASGELGPPYSYGWPGAAGTNFWVDPVNRIVGIFMVQSVPHQTQLAQQFKVLTYQALME